MAEPVIAQKSPFAVELAAGDYWWCRCGLSKRQPFCAGSHKTTAFTGEVQHDRAAEDLAVRLQA
jgi:CDGSH-type Zn-finger protein